jgi:hypothetical protein
MTEQTTAGGLDTEALRRAADGTRVLATATVELRDGEIVRQVMVEASDEYPQGTRSLP